MSRQEIEHPTISIPHRGIKVDKYALLDLERLWKANINTFYSCQGGPIYIKKGRMYYAKAYIMIHQRDMFKASALLSQREPMCDVNLDKHLNPGLVCIRFTPCEDARAGKSAKFYEDRNGAWPEINRKE